MNYQNEEVIVRNLSFAGNSSFSTQALQYHTARRTSNSSVYEPNVFEGMFGRTGAQSVCSLVRGPIPVFKLIWTRAATAAWLLLFILLPIITALWLVCASAYYVFYGAELERRQKILDRNRLKLAGQTQRMKTE